MHIFKVTLSASRGSHKRGRAGVSLPPPALFSHCTPVTSPHKLLLHCFNRSSYVTLHRTAPKRAVSTELSTEGARASQPPLEAEVAPPSLLGLSLVARVGESPSLPSPQPCHSRPPRLPPPRLRPHSLVAPLAGLLSRPAEDARVQAASSTAGGPAPSRSTTHQIWNLSSGPVA